LKAALIDTFIVLALDLDSSQTNSQYLHYLRLVSRIKSRFIFSITNQS
jgi:hypothetical protein